VRILAVDYGERRIGLAVSDELGIAAHGLPTVEVTSPRNAANAVAKVAVEQGAGLIVVGLPRNMDGSLGPRAQATLEFCELCRHRLRVPVETFDERLTTARARKALHEIGLDARRQRAHTDRIAAVMILQDYLVTTAPATASPGRAEDEGSHETA